MTTPFFAVPHENHGSMGTSLSEDSLLRKVLGSSILSLSPTLNVEPGTCEPLEKNFDIDRSLSYSEATFGSGFGVHPQSLLKKASGVFRSTHNRAISRSACSRIGRAGQKQEDHGKAESKQIQEAAERIRAQA
jgi:hypothetical protein